MTQPQPVLITLFGASGDLAARKLYPAFYRLFLSGRLSHNFALIGTARREWSHDYFRSIVRESIISLIEDDSHAEKFLSRFYYLPHNVEHTEHYINLKNLADQLDKQYQLAGNRIFYMSTSPTFFPIISQHLKEEGCLSPNGFNRLIIEKPFGNNAATAQKLQHQLTQSFDESQIYRIDHYLGKEIVQGIYNLRFDNGLFNRQWNKDTIDSIQITLSETVGVEDRAVFYETNGVTKDMIQNHALQLLALIAMQQPTHATPEAIQAEKVNILQHIHLYKDLGELEQNVVRAQYGENIEEGLNAYHQEENVNPNSITETYFSARIKVDLPQWQGVPFYIRSGKRLNHKSTIIDVQFKPINNSVKGERLRLEIAPRLGYTLWLNLKSMGYQNKSQLTPLKHYYSDEITAQIPEDYERLIGECIVGDRSHFADYEEVLAAWKYIDRVHELWNEQSLTTLPTYSSGSAGPDECDKMLAQTEHHWMC